MSIFDDDLIDKLTREAELKKQEVGLKKQEEEKKRQEEARQKEIACAYIMECLRDFPAAAKKVGLQTKALKIYNQSDGDNVINAWIVAIVEGEVSSSTFYMVADGDCFDYGFYTYPCRLSLREMAATLYFSCDWCRKGEEKIKEGFVKALSGQYT